MLIIISAYVLGDASNTFFPDRSATPSEKEPGDSQDIGLERIDWAQCRDDAGQIIDCYWIVLHLTNLDPSLSVRGQGTIRVLDKAGQETSSRSFGRVGDPDIVDRYSQYYLNIPAGSRGWLVVPEMLSRRQCVRARDLPASRIDVVYDELYWNSRDSNIDCSWQTSLVSYTMSAGQYPRHALTIGITNTGETTLHNTTIFGVVYNSLDQMVDIVWSEQPGRWPSGRKIRTGEHTSVDVESISQTGRCLGAFDPNGYKARYWVNTITPAGQPLSSYHETGLLTPRR